EREFSPDKRNVNLTFVINEGPAYTVERVIITGNEHFDESRLRTELSLKQGQIYSEQKADADVRGLLKLYREDGFIDAGVKHSVKFISRSSVNVGFEVTEGERFRIGRINITGNEQTQDKVVRRVLDEYDFQPGRSSGGCWMSTTFSRVNGIMPI
ncbi:MAG: POTRA domain-containing protein, partial [Planctomycetota bacterium]